ncbi:hypothetical protein BDY19DRAFT_1056194 [Irpex rosettiformis]|uniref:Uncharacterized protein n=1 Tax=Irpex rosettiformis TaxID=378272 RepID=A0ACB8U5T8_9APHY|nr:hypothetical protein BDY19DRAFT_1056194 [Irpex rosettiformis]
MSTLAKQLRRGATGMPSIRPFRSTSPSDQLPTEILAYIFKLGVEVFEQPGDSSAETSVRTERPEIYEFPCVPLDTSFQDSVSKVCSRWRHIALDMALLWNYVDFAEGPPYERSLMYIQRSKNAPLDILIHARYSETDGRRKRGNTLCLEHAMGIILPHLHRWRSFCFLADDFYHMEPLVEMLGSVGAATELQTLCLHVNNEDSHWESEYFPEEAEANRTIRIFGGQIPKLRFLWICRAFFSWKLSNVMQPNLVNLTAMHIFRHCAMSLAEFLNQLQRTPKLHTLGLYGYDMPEKDEAFDPSLYTSVTLPQLTRLNISPGIRQCELVDLLKHITMPKLRSLGLRLSNKFYFLRSLFVTLLDLIPLENLAKLTMAPDVWSEAGDWADLATEFCGRLKNIETLEIIGDISPFPMFLSTWETQEAFPRVSTLIVHNTRNPSAFRGIVERSSSRPLERVIPVTESRWDQWEIRTYIELGQCISAEQLTLQSKLEHWGGPQVEYL